MIANVAMMYGYSLDYLLHQITYPELIALWLYGNEMQTNKAIEQAFEVALTLYGLPEDVKEPSTAEKWRALASMEQFVVRPAEMTPNRRPDDIS